MSIHTSNKDSSYDIANKRCAGTKRIYKAYFYDGSGIYVNINLDPEIIERLRITPEIELTEEIVTTTKGAGILILPMHSKNKSTGSGYQANPADDSEDSGLDYQHEHDF